MKTNKYLFFNNYAEIDYWYKKVRDFLEARKVIWKCDSLHKVLDVGSQKWIFVKNDGRTNFTGMREIHAYYDMATKFENDFEGTIVKLIKGEELE